MSNQVVSSSPHRMPPEARCMRFSSRGNSDFKWRQDKNVIGALEIPSDPFFDYKGSTRDMIVTGRNEEYNECKALWNSLKLKRSFVKACEGIPPSMKCCGLVCDKDETIKDTVKLLNRGWIKPINKELKAHGFKITCFTWAWSNASGKAETNVFLIRFHSLSTRRFIDIHRKALGSSVVEKMFLTEKETSNNEDEKSTSCSSGRDNFEDC